MFTPAVRVAGRRVAGNARPNATRTFASQIGSTPSKYQWNDPLASNNLFTEDELAVSESAESYCQDQLVPRILGKFSYTPIASRWLLTLFVSSRGIPHREI